MGAVLSSSVSPQIPLLSLGSEGSQNKILLVLRWCEAPSPAPKARQELSASYPSLCSSHRFGRLLMRLTWGYVQRLQCLHLGGSTPSSRGRWISSPHSSCWAGKSEWVMGRERCQGGCAWRQEGQHQRRELSLGMSPCLHLISLGRNKGGMRISPLTDIHPEREVRQESQHHAAFAQ